MLGFGKEMSVEDIEGKGKASNQFITRGYPSELCNMLFKTTITIQGSRRPGSLLVHDDGAAMQ